MRAMIRPKATREDVLAVLMQGAGQASVMRLAAGGGMAQVEKGFSYALDVNGRPLAIGGLWPASGPPRLLQIAQGRPVFAVWFVAAPAAAPFLRTIKRACAVVFGDRAAEGAMVVAEVDPDIRAAPKLARLVGLVPLERIDGHDLWVFHPTQEEAAWPTP